MVVPPSLFKVIVLLPLLIVSMFFRFFANWTSKVPLPSAFTLILPDAEVKFADAALSTPSPIIVTKVFNL